MSAQIKTASERSARRSRFDVIADHIAKPRGHNLRESIDHFEHAWNRHFRPSFPRASSRHTGRGPGLLDLPPEIRLVIYSWLNGRLPQFFVGIDDDDAVDIASIMVWKHIPPVYFKARTDWTWVFTHPTLFREGIDGILKRHCTLVRSVDDIQRTSPYLESARSIILDFGEDVSPDAARRALCSLKDLPRLERLTIKVTASTLTYWDFPDPTSGFEKLNLLWFRNPTDEYEAYREEQDKKDKLEALERQLEEAEARLAAWTPDESSEGTSMLRAKCGSMLRGVERLELDLAVLKIKAEVRKLKLDDLGRSLRGVRDPREEARWERRQIMWEQEDKLRKQLGMGPRWTGLL